MISSKSTDCSETVDTLTTYVLLDLDQVRLSKVRREPWELIIAPRSGARGRDGLGSLAQFRIRFIILAGVNFSDFVENIKDARRRITNVKEVN